MKEDFIVYGAFDDNGICLYVGEGKPDRYKHITSGVSHVYEANRWHFKDKPISVEILHKGLTKDESRRLEKVEIDSRNPAWNKATPNKKFGTKIENFALDRFRSFNKHATAPCTKKRNYETIIRDICYLMNSNGITTLLRGQNFTSAVDTYRFLAYMSESNNSNYPSLKHVFEVSKVNRNTYVVKLRDWN